jgi:C4-dicarboxylate transporter
MNSNKQTKRIDVYYGVLTACGLIVFFLLMKVVGWVHVVELRVLNLFIMAIGIYLALKKFRQTDINQQFNYMRAFFLGVTTSIFASFIFAVFLFIYVGLIDHALMKAIVEKEPMGRYLNPYVVSFIVAVEGILSGILVTFIIINTRNANEIEDDMKKKKP